MLRPDLEPHSLICVADSIEASSVDRLRLDALRASGVELDSRLVQPGDLFVALPGRTVHGAQHVAQAIAQGAVAVLTDPSGAGLLTQAPIEVFVASDLRTRLGHIASSVYLTSEGSHSRRSLSILAVTGTNGKTTVAHLVAAGLRNCGVATGLIGTIGISVGDQHWPTPRTTPESVHLHAALAAMAQRGVRAVALEASSHALAEGRLDGLVVDVAGYTNLSQDHLDYHGGMEEYFQAKAQLFTPRHARLGVVGIDDAYGPRLARQASIGIQTWSAGDDEHPSAPDADWRLVPVHGVHGVHDVDGADVVGLSESSWKALGPDGSVELLPMPLPGAFNRANVLCAYAMLRCLTMLPGVGPDLETILSARAAAQGLAHVVVPGRMEPIVVKAGQAVQAIVDYAHTPEAIARVLQAMRVRRGGVSHGSVQPDSAAGKPSKLIAVIGAGGNRDRDKRRAMGAAAASWADVVIITDDNPRDEDPSSIRAAVIAGAQQGGTGAQIMEVADRAEAIDIAVRCAVPSGCVAILGKGHERTQEVAGMMHQFDDREELAGALRRVYGISGELS